MQIHRDGRFAVKFQGLPRRNSTLYLHLHFHLLALRAAFSLLSYYYLLGAAAFFPKLYELSVRSSQLLCWELTGQHPISNKACRSCRSCLTSTHLRFHPSRIPYLILPKLYFQFSSAHVLLRPDSKPDFSRYANDLLNTSSVERNLHRDMCIPYLVSSITTYYAFICIPVFFMFISVQFLFCRQINFLSYKDLFSCCSLMLLDFALQGQSSICKVVYNS